MSRSISPAQMRNLALKSGNRCYYPKCETKILENGNYQAHISHIKGVKGPRYDPELKAKELNHESNLIFLCYPHHRLVDFVNENDWTVEKLLEIKKGHEEESVKEINLDEDTVLMIIDIVKLEIQGFEREKEDVNRIFKSLHRQRINQISTEDESYYILDGGQITIHLISKELLLTQHDEGEISPQRVDKYMKPLWAGGWDHEHNATGYAHFREIKERKSSNHQKVVTGYFQINYSGLIEIADRGVLSGLMHPVDIREAINNSEMKISADTIQHKLQIGLEQATNLLNELDHSLPYLGIISIAKIQGFVLDIGERFWSNGSKKISKDRFTSDVFQIDNIGEDTWAHIQPILRDIWRASGYPNVQKY